MSHTTRESPLEGEIKQAWQAPDLSKSQILLAISDRQPAMRYNLGGESNGFYAEFLTPLTGSGKIRDGKGGWREGATEVHAGVVAQKLRHLEVLLYRPSIVTIPKDESGLEVAVGDLRLPNPVSFMIQKLLIRDKRARHKRAQDVLANPSTVYKLDFSDCRPSLATGHYTALTRIIP